MGSSSPFGSRVAGIGYVRVFRTAWNREVDQEMCQFQLETKECCAKRDKDHRTRPQKCDHVKSCDFFVGRIVFGLLEQNVFRIVFIPAEEENWSLIL